jgi:hypothetical protein
VKQGVRVGRWWGCVGVFPANGKPVGAVTPELPPTKRTAEALSSTLSLSGTAPTVQTGVAIVPTLTWPV